MFRIKTREQDERDKELTVLDIFPNKFKVAFKWY